MNARPPRLVWPRLLSLFLLASSTGAQLLPVLPPPPPPQFNEAVDNGSLGQRPTHSFVTQEDMKPPIVNYVKWTPECDDGHYNFITPRGWTLTTPGPVMLDNYGHMVWGHHFENSFGGQAYNFRVQTFRGEDYLTFWLGDDRVKGHGAGAYYMLNSSYDVVHKVSAAGGFSADLHEFLITPDDTALLTVYEPIPADVSRFKQDFPENIPKENRGYIWDCLFQEVDIQTKELLFEWRATDHVDMNESFIGIWDKGHKGEPWDWYHINSVDKDELGNYLISARFPHSITYIDGKTKETIWQLGGKQNDFMDLSGGDALNFAWQHDAHFFPADAFPDIYQPPSPPRLGYTTRILSVFDNAAEDQHYTYGIGPSRGLLLELTYPDPGSERARSRRRYGPSDPIKVVPETETALDGTKLTDPNVVKINHINGTDPAWTVRLIKSYDSPAHVRASSQGSMQVALREHGSAARIIIGYGLNAAWAEFAVDGTLLCDVHFGAKTSWDHGDIQSYRAYKMPWTGRPRWRPKVEISDDDEEVYVSWNGATDVVAWVLQCSDKSTQDDAAWADVVSVPKLGFETTIPVPSEVKSMRYLRVLALAANARRFDHGASEIIDRGAAAAYLPSFIRRLPPGVASMSGIKVLMLVTLNFFFMLVIYQMYGRYLSWRHGRRGLGLFSWRKNSAQYRPLAA